MYRSCHGYGLQKSVFWRKIQMGFIDAKEFRGYGTEYVFGAVVRLIGKRQRVVMGMTKLL
jgi:hypothetical protein